MLKADKLVPDDSEKTISTQLHQLAVNWEVEVEFPICGFDMVLRYYV